MGLPFLRVLRSWNWSWNSIREPLKTVLRPVAGPMLLCLLTGVWLSARPMAAQADLSAFRWIDFHDVQSPKDGPTIAWVTQSLKAEKWTAIREIGVQWDSAVVMTTLRATPESTPPSDTFTVWSVSLAKREVEPLLHGVSPRLLNWTTFGGLANPVPELPLVYQDCFACDAPSTFFTTLYYNMADHAWRARWVRGDQAAVLSTGGTVEGVARTQIYGLINDAQGRDLLATWTHNDYGKVRPAEDIVFEYSVDPATAQEQTLGLSGDHAEAMELRLCMADPRQIDPSLGELARGQDTAVCQELLAARAKLKPARRPTTTPPANNRGQSLPPGFKPGPKPASMPVATPGARPASKP